MPTTASATFGNKRLTPLFNPEDAMESMVNVKLKASTTYAAGTVLGEITASPGTYGPYVAGHSDGTQIPAGILQYAAVTDSSSNITNFDEWGNVALTAPMFTEGAFRTQDLTGLDANAVTLLGGHLIEGSVTTGIFSF